MNRNADGEAPAGAGVAVEDLGGQVGVVRVLAAEAVVHLQVERRGSPEGPPPPGEGLRSEF